MSEDKRYKLSMSNVTNTDAQYCIIDTEQEVMTIYNDLGFWAFSSAPALCDLLNAQQKEITELTEDLDKAVFVDMDGGNGCYNCKWDSGGICEKLMKGSVGYIEMVSWCNLKYWERRLK